MLQFVNEEEIRVLDTFLDQPSPVFDAPTMRPAVSLNEVIGNSISKILQYAYQIGF